MKEHESPVNAGARASALPDLQKFGLRQFLASLDTDEIEHRDGATELATVAQVLEGNPKAVLFERPSGSTISLCGNVAASRERLAKAFGTSSDKLLQTVLGRLRQKGELVEVSRDAAPVQEVVLTGEDCDLTALPVHLQHGLDGAPYISASIDFALQSREWLDQCRHSPPHVAGAPHGRHRFDGRVGSAGDLSRPMPDAGERMPIAFAVGSTRSITLPPPCGFRLTS
ncbi:MAG: UbiD family decarboxylase domain-containing protein [Aliidongia sp.]